MRHHDPGNLYIQFEVVFPESRPGLSPGELKTLKKITGPKLKPETNGDDQAKKAPEGDKAPKGDKAPEGDKAPKGDKAKKGDKAPKGAKAPQGDVMDIDQKPTEDKKVVEEKEVIEEKEEMDEHYELPPLDVPDPAYPNDPTRRLLVTLEDQYLEKVDQSSQDRANVATMEDDDEDGMPSGGERVQCASQ